MIAQVLQPLSAVEARAPDDPAWVRFLAAHPAATAFHHPAWSRVLAESYGYRPFVLSQSDPDGGVQAGLPVMEVHGRLASLPFTDHCPPLLSPAADLAQFAHGLQQWRWATGQPGMVIYDMLPPGAGIQHLPRGVRHLLPLEPGSQRAFNRLNGKVRSSIRKAQRDLRPSISHSPDALGPFYQLHVETRRRLGVPVQPRRFMANVLRSLAGEGLAFTVFAHLGDRPVAAAVFLAWNGTLIYKFAASDPRYWAMQPNNLVLWAAIEWGSDNGYRLLDLGRTDLDNQGLREFKSHWGATEVPLVYTYVAASPPRSAPRLITQALAKLIQNSPPVVCRAMGELLYARAALSV